MVRDSKDDREEVGTELPPPAIHSNQSMYRTFCAECNCRQNSAVVKYLASVEDHKALVALPFQNFYLGPRGTLPILRLLRASQTIEVVDLRGNGLDNATVALLCEVLEKHKGVHTLLLGDNSNITVEGGKTLLSLLERNHGITTINVQGTDIYESIQLRLAMAVDEHRAAASRDVGLVPSRPATGPTSRTSPERNYHRESAVVGDGLLSIKTTGMNKSGADPVPRITLQERRHTASGGTDDGTAAAAASSVASAVVAATPGVRRPSPPGRTALESSSAVGPLQPRPPPPALASRESARLSEKQRNELLQKYQERASLYQQVVRSDASRAADRARLELQQIEQRRTADGSLSATRSAAGQPSGAEEHQNNTSVVEGHASNREATIPARDPPGQPTGSHPHAASPSRVLAAASIGAKAAHHSTSGAPGMSTSPIPVRSPKKFSVASTTRPDSRNTEVFGSSVTDYHPGTHSRWSVSDLPAGDDNEPQKAVERSATMAPTGPGERPRDGRDSAAPQRHSESPKALVPLQPLTLSRDEQFKELFTRGCQQYQDKQLDAAYLTWNEAMDLAVTNKHREWMAVIANNLQRLSYEILVTEGVRHLETHHLEEADRSFQLALDVANKAKNAQWEGEMHRARKNVQQAVFQRSHEAASSLFERAQQVREVAVTADDRFQAYGEKSLQEHTSEFAAEWTRMLFVKEAMEMWADAAMVARKIGGQSAKQLQQTLSTAVYSVCVFLAKRFFVSEPHGNILSLQRTSKLTYAEGMKLVDLWTDVISKTQTTLNSKLWDGVAATELGNLYLATHQLPQALNQFEKVVDIAIATNDKLLASLGHTYLGILHWQRSNTAVSEKCFIIALEHWKALRMAQRGSDRDGAAGGFDGGRRTGDVAHSLPPHSVGTSRKADAASTLDSAFPAGDGDGADDNTNARATADGGGAASEEPTLADKVSPEYLNVMLSKCYTYLIRLMFQSSRYRDALEMLERGLLHRYKDRLYDKMLHNFPSKPTIDHVAAVATALDSPLVYYETSYRFDWNVSTEAYVVSQQLLVWVVPKEAEMKVVRVDVTGDFGVESIDVLIEAVRRALVVQPLHSTYANSSSGGGSALATSVSLLSSTTTTGGGILTHIPFQAWREPLQLLYEILFHPIADFIAAHDSQSAKLGGLVTIIPSSSLFLVPFHALVTRGGKFLVETYAVQLAFCAVQAAFGALSAKRVKDRDLQRRVVVVQPEGAGEVLFSRVVPDAKKQFPLDCLRSQEEGKRILHALQGGATGSHNANNTTASRAGDAHAKATRGGTDPATAPSPTASAGVGSAGGAHPGLSPVESELVEELSALRDSLYRTRLLHVATPVVATTENADGSYGSLVVATGPDELGLFRASEIQQYEVFAELVVLSNANMAADVIRTTKEGVLGVCRSFLSSGVACVIAGQWCTPDMTPAELFEPFYALTLAPSNRNGHKAKLLALAIRKLLTDDRYRFNPRLWCGYFVVGVGIV